MKNRNTNQKNKHKTNSINILGDLKKSILISVIGYFLLFIALYVNKKYIYTFIEQPVRTLLKNNTIVFIYTNIFESFTADISLCGYSAFFLAIPLFLFSLYKFFAPSLYQNEKKTAILLSIFGIIMLILSFLLFYLFIFPQAIKFFLFENMPQNQDIIAGQLVKLPMLKISEYISTFFHLVIGFGLVFQAPLVLFGLVKLGILSASSLSKHRRIAIVIIFIISAIITPPDVMSQIVCATLLIIIYEITNLFIKRINTNKKINKRKK